MLKLFVMQTDLKLYWNLKNIYASWYKCWNCIMYFDCIIVNRNIYFLEQVNVILVITIHEINIEMHFV